MAAEREKLYVYKTTLKTVYGLTDAMVAGLDGPDKRVPDPHYRSGPEASLYLVERVEAWVEAHRDAVEEARRRRAARSVVMSAVMARRREELLAWARGVAIDVERFPEKCLEVGRGALRRERLVRRGCRRRRGRGLRAAPSHEL